MAEMIKKEYEQAKQIESCLRENNITLLDSTGLALIKNNNPKLYFMLIDATNTYIWPTNDEDEFLLEINSWLNYWHLFGKKDLNVNTNYRLANVLLRIKCQENKQPLDFDSYYCLLKHFFSLLLIHIYQISEFIQDEKFLSFVSDYDNFLNLIVEIVRIFCETNGISITGVIPNSLSFDINDYIDIIKASYQNLVQLNKS